MNPFGQETSSAILKDIVESDVWEMCGRTLELYATDNNQHRTSWRQILIQIIYLRGAFVCFWTGLNEYYNAFVGGRAVVKREIDFVGGTDAILTETVPWCWYECERMRRDGLEDYAILLKRSHCKISVLASFLTYIIYTLSTSDTNSNTVLWPHNMCPKPERLNFQVSVWWLELTWFRDLIFPRGQS